MFGRQGGMVTRAGRRALTPLLPDAGVPSDMGSAARANSGATTVDTELDGYRSAPQAPYISAAAFSSSGWKSGWATVQSSRARSFRVLPRRVAMPNSVTT